MHHHRSCFLRSFSCQSMPIYLARLSLAIVLLVSGLSFGTSRLYAQSAWEFNPYRVQLVIAVSPALPDPDLLEQAIERQVLEQGELMFRATWQSQVMLASPALEAELSESPADITRDRLKELLPEYAKFDKLMLIHAARSKSLDGTIDLRVGEFDVRSELWLGKFFRPSLERSLVPYAAVDGVVRAFTPMMRIERVDGNKLAGRARAGGLVTNDIQPAAITDQAVLRPVVRRNDRKGEPMKGGIQSVPWSLIRTTSRTGAQLTGELISGFRYAIPVKGGQRTERLAFVVKPQAPVTDLVLQSRGTNPQPLVGYGVYLRSETGEDATLIGVSDWRGAVRLPASLGIQVLLVKSGQQLLARLPLVPGQESELVASLPDDTPRLEAEGVVVSFQSRIMDLVAQRELAAARFRKRLAEGKIDEAQVLLDQFRELDSGENLQRAIDQQSQRISSTDKATQARIDKLFTTARGLVPQFVKSDTASILAQELAKRKAGGAAAPTAPQPSPAPAAPVAPTQPAAAPVPASSPGSGTPADPFTGPPAPPTSPAAGS